MSTPSGSRAARIAATLALFAASSVACNTGDVAQVDGGAIDGGAIDGAPEAGDASGEGGAALRWFTTCGDPICRDPVDGGSTPPNGVSPCTSERAGDGCATAGAQCDPGDGCGVLLRCAASDPKLGQGGCPVSTRSAKNDIRYLNEKDLESVAARLEAIRLATYSYKSDPSKREHLGFIIEDDPASMAIADGRTSVDLYGYTSMVVAAMKVQSQKLERQEAELTELRRRLAALEHEHASDARMKR